MLTRKSRCVKAFLLGVRCPEHGHTPPWTGENSTLCAGGSGPGGARGPSVRSRPNDSRVVRRLPALGSRRAHLRNPLVPAVWPCPRQHRLGFGPRHGELHGRARDRQRGRRTLGPPRPPPAARLRGARAGRGLDGPRPRGRHTARGECACAAHGHPRVPGAQRPASRPGLPAAPDPVERHGSHAPPAGWRAFGQGCQLRPRARPPLRLEHARRVPWNSGERPAADRSPGDPPYRVGRRSPEPRGGRRGDPARAAVRHAAARERLARSEPPAIHGDADSRGSLPCRRHPAGARSRLVPLPALIHPLERLDLRGDARRGAAGNRRRRARCRGAPGPARRGAPLGAAGRVASRLRRCAELHLLPLGGPPYGRRRARHARGVFPASSAPHATRVFPVGRALHAARAEPRRGARRLHPIGGDAYAGQHARRRDGCARERLPAAARARRRALALRPGVPLRGRRPADAAVRARAQREGGGGCRGNALPLGARAVPVRLDGQSVSSPASQRAGRRSSTARSHTRRPSPRR